MLMSDASSKAEMLERLLFSLRMAFKRISRSVTRDDAKSESSKMFRLNGTMPVQEKADKIFASVTDVGQASLTIPGMS